MSINSVFAMLRAVIVGLDGLYQRSHKIEYVRALELLKDAIAELRKPSL